MLQIRGGDKFLSVVKPLETNLDVGILVGWPKSRVSCSEPIPLLLGVPQPPSGSSVDATYANLSRNAQPINRCEVEIGCNFCEGVTISLHVS
jgi:hypothetical protein